MTTTLLDRLTAAIDAKGARARATLTDLCIGGNPDRPAGTTSGEWVVERYLDEVTIREVGYHHVALAGDVDLTSETWTGLEPAYAEHIADNDPVSVLRGVAAERKLLDIAFDQAAQIDRDWGCMCSADEIRAGLCPREQPDRLDIVIALAAAYDLTVEED